MTNKSDQIRNAYNDLPIGANNRDVAAEVERRYGWKASPQAIYGAIGKEACREAHNFTGPQVMEAQATARLFPSMDAYHECVGMIRRYDGRRAASGGPDITNAS